MEGVSSKKAIIIRAKFYTSSTERNEVVTIMNNLYISFVQICIFSLVFSSILTTVVSTKHKCGYDSCTKPKEGYLNVHMVSHTHDDVGWLKTVDQYFYGSKQEIQMAGVRNIIDSVVEGLWSNPHRKFIYVEMAYFWKWWLLQNENTRNRVRKLVNQGRLEFISGGWTMHDEAVTHYQSIVDQMSWGFRRLHDMFGTCGRPRVGWQIDPFGHSSESASIMARFGFDGLLFGRLDYEDQKLRKKEKRLEMIWEASSNLGSKADLFTSILYNLYSAPDYFCFDIVCGDTPIIDDTNSQDYNADRRAANFVEYLKKVSEVYTTNNVLITMGGDFTYQSADHYFLNLDRLMKAVNELQPNGSRMNLFYSTPSCYLKAVNDENQTYTTKNDDFIPYASKSHAFWTGYFTSRPSLKYFERIGNNFLQICKQLFTLSNMSKNELSKLDEMREAMGVLQHHDAITGTEKQLVAYDYARLLNVGFTRCGDLANTALRNIMVKLNPVAAGAGDILLQSCMLLNISSCNVTESYDTFVVTLYNPLSRSVPYYVRLPVIGNGESFAVFDPSGKTVETQVVPIPLSVQQIPGRTSGAKEEIVFLADNLPALGYRSYYVSAVYSQYKQKKTSEVNPEKENIAYDTQTGKVTVGNVTIEQSFLWYNSFDKKEGHGQWSGAYIFRPDGEVPMHINDKIIAYKGPIVDEVHQVFNNWVSQVIRKYHDNSNYVEFSWLIGPIPIADNRGKEVVTRYTINNIASNKTFYTDSNGREMLQRFCDKRPTFNITLLEPIAGNYYPVPTRIMIKDEHNQVSVITDRAQGGSSIKNGQLELMLHRRILEDDGYGVDEALNETAFGTGLVVRGTHYVTSGNPLNQTAIDRMIIQQKILSVWSFFTPTTLTFDEWKTNYNMEYFGLRKALPPNIQILTLEPWSNNWYLIRLEHIMEKNDDPYLSKPVKLNLKKLFHPFVITSVKETTLGGNELLKNMKRLIWKKESGTTLNSKETEYKKLPNVKLKAMEIRSFIVKIKHK